VGGLLLGGRGKLTSAACRQKVLELISEAHTAGTGLGSACSEIGICLRTLKRWRKALIADGDGIDRRKGSSHYVSQRFSAEECQRILLIKAFISVLNAVSIGFYISMGSYTAAVGSKSGLELGYFLSPNQR
jgi:hypothetical protein